MIQNHIVPNTGPYALAHRYHNRERVPAAALAFFLGGFGAHKFYLGRPAMGVFYLMFFFTPLPWIAGFVEGLMYLLSSGQGFDAEHNYRP